MKNDPNSDLIGNTGENDATRPIKCSYCPEIIYRSRFVFKGTCEDCKKVNRQKKYKEKKNVINSPQ